ncbi:unnamed protein product [Calypogeia fissa]
MSEDLIDFLSLEDNGDTLLQQVTFLNHPNCCHRCKRQGHQMKDCSNEPHFRRDSQSRLTLQQTSTDTEEAAIVPPQDATPPVIPPQQGSPPQVLTARLPQFDHAVRDSNTNTADIDSTPPVRITVPISNIIASKPLFSPPSVEDPVVATSLEDRVLLLDPSSDLAQQSTTSPTLPIHLCIRTSSGPVNAGMSPPRSAFFLGSEVPPQPPLKSPVPESSRMADPLLHPPGISPSNHGNSSGSKRWADYSLDSENELETLSHTPGGSRLVISPHQLTVEPRQRDRSISPSRCDSQ